MKISLKTYFVYIVKCNDDSYYTGITNDIDRRLYEHNNIDTSKAYTYSRRPVKLVYSEQFQDPSGAIDWEKQIKGWSRKKKEALIRKDFDALVELSNYKKNRKNKV